jgi:hypothetical protein
MDATGRVRWIVGCHDGLLVAFKQNKQNVDEVDKLDALLHVIGILVDL